MFNLAEPKSRHKALTRNTFCIVVFVLLLVGATTANAGERRFTFTYEAATHAPGDVEYEQWITWKTDKDTDSAFDRIDVRHELEFGITDDFQLALYLSDWRYQRGSSVGDGTEWRDVAIELMYNISDPATESIGFTLYGELKIGDELLELEGKIIAQKNFGKWVFAYNATIEAEWEGSNYSEDKGEFQQTLGGSYQFSPKIFAGFELLHEIEYDDWDTWGDHLLYAGPNASYRADQWWVTVTPLFQLTDSESEANFQLRLIFGIDF
ncbi:MAG: hypothetical protein IH984_00870 [Planctomycetes bacterium]|nr:hypothetical protein [Planctomycetota bacterium]